MSACGRRRDAIARIVPLAPHKGISPTRIAVDIDTVGDHLEIRGSKAVAIREMIGNMDGIQCIASCDGFIGTMPTVVDLERVPIGGASAITYNQTERATKTSIDLHTDRGRTIGRIDVIDRYAVKCTRIKMVVPGRASNGKNCSRWVITDNAKIRQAPVKDRRGRCAMQQEGWVCGRRCQVNNS